MAQYSSVKRSRVVADERIDAEFYRSAYLAQEARIAGLNPQPLSHLALVSDGNHVSISEKFTDSGVRYLRGQDLSDFFISDNAPVYIPYAEYEKLRRSHMKADDVLLSIVGTVGMVAIVTDEHPHLTGNCKIAIIRPKGVNPYYLAVYLASQGGQGQIERRIRGAVQQGLILPDLKSLPIPVVDDEFAQEIEGLVSKSRERRKEAEDLYVEAESLLVAELGLDQLDLSNELAYDAALSYVVAAERWDADYYQPRYDAALDRISSYQHGCVAVAELLAPARVRIDPSRHPDKEFRYIEIGSVDTNTGWVEPSTILGREAPANAKIKVSGGEILASLVRPTRGAIAIVPEDIGEAGVCSGAFYVGYAPSPLKETMYVYLRVIRWIFERFCTGTSYPTIKLGHVERVLAPLVAEALQFQLAAKVQESIRARKEARSLLDQAKRRVEEFIKEEGRP